MGERRVSLLLLLITGACIVGAVLLGVRHIDDLIECEQQRRPLLVTEDTSDPTYYVEGCTP